MSIDKLSSPTSQEARTFEQSLADFSTLLAEIDDVQQVWQATTARFANLGLEYVTYVHVGSSAAEQNFAFSNMPAWWGDHYLDTGRVSRDPFIHLCRSFVSHNTGPEFLDRHPYLDDAERLFIQEAGETGMRSGFSRPTGLIGMPWWGGWNFGTSLSAGRFERLQGEVETRAVTLGMFASQRIEALMLRPAAPEPEAKLSLRECACLELLAAGKRTAEIAFDLGISDATVDFHLKNTRTKLGASTREEALAKAIRAGLLSQSR